VSDWSEALTALYGVNWAVAVVIEIVFVVIAATVVRRHRPDAYKPLLVWASVALVYSVLGSVFGFFTTRWVATEGIDALYRRQVISAAVGIVIHVVFAVLLMRALVVLAQPPKKIEIDPEGPYR
jgi:hypothetical protein